MILRTIVFSIVVLTLLFGATFYLDGQTTLAPRNLATPIPGGIIYVIAPDGKSGFARLDPTLQLTADNTGFLTIKATPIVNERVVVFKPTAVGTTLTLPSEPMPNSVVVASNGLTLSEAEDYTRAGRVLTFVPAHAPVPGYIYNVRYREP